MPNWCLNQLAVAGPTDKLQAFKDAMKGDKTDFSLEKFSPTPAETLVAQGGPTKPDWYNWRVENWGTKWDVTASLEIEEDKPNGTSVAYYTFDSAWSPPSVAIEGLIEAYPELSFALDWDEPGMCMRGEIRGARGKVLCDVTETYDPQESELTGEALELLETDKED